MRPQALRHAEHALKPLPRMVIAFRFEQFFDRALEHGQRRIHFVRHARAEEAEGSEPVLRFDMRQRLSEFVLAAA